MPPAVTKGPTRTETRRRREERHRTDLDLCVPAPLCETQSRLIPVFTYLGGSAPGGVEVHRSRSSQENRRGGSGAWALRTCPSPIQHPNHVASPCDVLRRRFMGRNPLQTAHRRIPAEGPSESEASNRSSSAGARIFIFPGTNRLFLTPRTDSSSSGSGTRNGQDPRSRPLNRFFSSRLVVRTCWAPGGQDGLVARKDDVGTPTSKA
jgi:hypothetical protein